MGAPLVSCLMPTYGRRHFVTQAVRYFLTQDYPATELIVVDDGPQPVDDLLQGDNRLRYVRLDRRVTIGAKRNLACQMAAGDLLIQWDDDDWYGPSRIRLQVADLLSGVADVTFLPQAWLLDLHTSQYWRNDDPIIGAGATFAFTSDAWQRAGGYGDSSAGEDWEFFHRILTRGGRSNRVETTESYIYVRHSSNSSLLNVDGHEGPGGSWRRTETPAFLPPAEVAFYRSLARDRPPAGRAPAPVAPSLPRPFRSPTGLPVPFALVHHANQHLIGDGYTNREDLGEVVRAFARVFRLHAACRVPLNLQLAGTLLEAIAWHYPAFLDAVRQLRELGLVELLGSTYSQNLMTVSSPEHNRRQLREALELYRRHLGVEPDEVRGFWVPERVWDTQLLARVVSSSDLPNGGYRYVVLDQRLAFPPGGGADGRERFDQTMPPVDGPGPGPVTGPFRIEGGHGLVLVPISAELRYGVPPRHLGDWARIGHALRQAAVGGGAGGALAVYADDLEKAAGVGPWLPGPWTPEVTVPYQRLLEWIGGQSEVEPVLLSRYLALHPVAESRAVGPGTYYELAEEMGAGEDYLRWWNDARWAPYRQALDDAERLLQHGPPRGAREARSGLWELGWKQLMASSYEGGWQVPRPGRRYEPAPWIRATAVHVRAVSVVAAAAEWPAASRGAPAWRAPAEAWTADIDGDGHDEVVLANGSVFGVITPRWGARLVYLFDLTRPDGALVVGTPADDWHLQEELNRCPGAPREHVGAFADVGDENQPFAVVTVANDDSGAHVALAATGPDGRGQRVKVFRLARGARHLEVTYALTEQPRQTSVDFALSPDYLCLLRNGRRGVTPLEDGRTRGWQNGPSQVWVRVPEGADVRWDVPPRSFCSHGLLLRATSFSPRFGLELGVGDP